MSAPSPTPTRALPPLRHTSPSLPKQLSRLSSAQLARKRKFNESRWESIIAECKDAATIQEVASKHPECSYDSIARRYKRFKEGDMDYAKQCRGSQFRIFSDEEESMLAAILWSAVDSEEDWIDQDTVRREAMDLYSHLHGVRALRLRCRDFSNSFILGFKTRHGFSTKVLNVSQKAREKEINSLAENNKAFIAQVKTAIEKYGARLVINMDETPARCFDIPVTAWGRQGERRKLSVSPKKNARKNITTIPAINALGGKLKFAWIRRSDPKTDRKSNWNTKYNIPTTVLSQVTPNGWTNSKSTCQWIREILLPYSKKAPCALLIDSYPPHWEPSVLKLAEDSKVKLICVPAGQTASLQPLDISFNAPFKVRRQQLSRDAIRARLPDAQDVGPVVRRAIEAYSKVPKRFALEGWTLLKKYQ